MPGARIAPLHEINSTKLYKHILPPISQNRIPSPIALKPQKPKKEKKESEKTVKDSDVESYSSEFKSSHSSNFKLPSLANPIDSVQYGSKPELDFEQLKKMHRMAFPTTARKLLLPDEAERPIVNGTSASVSKIASPYIQIIKEEGALSMSIIDPLSSIPKIDDSAIYIPVSKILKDKPINRISVQEKFPLLNSSQLSTLLLYLARIGDVDSVKYLCRTAMVNVNILDDAGRSPLVYAAIGGHTDTMKILLKSGAFVDAIDCGGRTALFHAAYYSLPDSIKVLLQYGADITHRDFYGKTVLHYSVFSDRIESTKLLLRTLRNFKFLSFFGVQKWELLIESFDESGVTPMMLAAYLGHVGHFKEMTSMNYKSAKVKTKNGYSCIHFCANNSHLHVAKYLLRKDRKLMYEAVNSGCKPIHLAARKGNYAFLDLLLKMDRNLVNVVDLKNRTPLHYASAYGHVSVIRILIEYGADVDYKDDQGVTALHYATMSNYYDCVQMLCKHGAIVEINDNQGRNALIWAFMQGHLGVCKFLMPLVNQQNYLSDSSRNTPLHISSLIGHFDACIYLLQSGAEVNARNDQGMTPLFQSIIMGWLDITKELIDGGATISEQDNFGRTPLHWAIVSYSNESIQLLLDHPDCMIYIPDFCGREPIHEAASSGNDELIKIFIQMGCDPSCTENNGLTPLHLACASGSISCCKILLDNDVPFNALDFSENRKTPLDIAYDQQCKECVELLRKTGCLTGTEIRNLAARAIQFSWNNYKVKKHTRDSSKYRNLQNNRHKLKAKSATKIQAWFRGAVQRKRYKRKLEIARIEKEREKEVKAALSALDQAKKHRILAEEDLRCAVEELHSAQKEKGKLMQVSKDDGSKMTKSNLHSSAKRFRSTKMNNTAAVIIQEAWRHHQRKRNQNKKTSSEKALIEHVPAEDFQFKLVSEDSTTSPTRDFNSGSSISTDNASWKSLHRQGTGSKLNTLPKSSVHTAPQAKEPSLPQNFASGTFNKVFKSTVAMNIKEREPSFGKTESPGLQPPLRGDRSVGKSMEIVEKMVVSRPKRLSFDHGDSLRNQIETAPVISLPVTESRRTRDSVQRSSSTVSSSGHNIGSIFIDSIPKGYDELNFHSIVRGISKKQVD